MWHTITGSPRHFNNRTENRGAILVIDFDSGFLEDHFWVTSAWGESLDKLRKDL